MNTMTETPALDSLSTTADHAVDASVSTEHSGDDLHRFQDLKQQLSVIQQHAQAALTRVSDYLTRLRPGRKDGGPAEIPSHLLQTLEGIAQKQQTLEHLLLQWYRQSNSAFSAGATASSAAPPAWALELQAVIANRFAGLEAQLESLVAHRLTDGGPINSALAVPSDEPPTVVLEVDDLLPGGLSRPAALAAPWLPIFMGEALFADPALSAPLAGLEERVLSSDPETVLLVGHLAVFRLSPPDRKPALLKDIGEAYYRCFPKPRDRIDPFEEAVARWLQEHCEAAGLPNSIEIVHPGERFDAARHASVERGGVEIVRVLGWVVLRDAGRVYSKASVQTR